MTRTVQRGSFSRRQLKAISHQATTAPAALAAGSTSNHVQVGGTDVQGPDHMDGSVYLSRHIRLRDRVRTLVYARP